MILKMFTIYDRKSCIHQPPAYCHNAGHAMRVFMGLFRKAGTVYNEFPEDFQVFEVGTFDDQSAELVKLERPHMICAGPELVEKKEIVSDVGDE